MTDDEQPREQPAEGTNPVASPEATAAYDPAIPTRSGHELRSDDLLAEVGTGRSGPHDMSTRVEDAPTTLGTDLGGSGSPTSRLWEEAERSGPRRHERTAREPEVDLPTPADNPGGPPPGRPEGA